MDSLRAVGGLHWHPSCFSALPPKGLYLGSSGPGWVLNSNWGHPISARFCTYQHKLPWPYPNMSSTGVIFDISQVGIGGGHNTLQACIWICMCTDYDSRKTVFSVFYSVWRLTSGPSGPKQLFQQLMNL